MSEETKQPAKESREPVVGMMKERIELSSQPPAVVTVPAKPIQTKPVEPIPEPEPIKIPDGPHCPKCKSVAIGMAGGMRHCNSCGYRWE